MASTTIEKVKCARCGFVWKEGWSKNSLKFGIHLVPICENCVDDFKKILRFLPKEIRNYKP